MKIIKDIKNELQTNMCMGRKDEDSCGDTNYNDNSERFLSSLVKVSISLSGFFAVLYSIREVVNTKAISNFWLYTFLFTLFITIIWVSIFWFFYKFKKEYYLESSQSKFYIWGSGLSKLFANIALLAASVGISLLLLNIIISKIIGIFSQDYYFITLFLLLIAGLLGIYVPIIIFRFITNKKISLRFDNVLISFFLIYLICFVLPSIFLGNFLYGETIIDMEKVVDKNIKSLLVKIELTGDVSNSDEILNSFKFSCNSLNKTNGLVIMADPNLNIEVVKEIYYKMMGCNITDYRIPIMKVNLTTIKNSNSTASNEMDSIYFYNVTSCSESRLLSGCGKGDGKFDINITIENLDFGKYQLNIERKWGLKYIEEVEII